MLTAEDLSTIPPLTVNQDLVVASAMGLRHIERNGHHYFARFAPLDATLADRVLAAHPDAFEFRDGAPDCASKVASCASARCSMHPSAWRPRPTRRA
ncbi:hypothetical protein [Homoserinibacter gongjuensis]|uniref:Uncharacterized protein n=1 Tax=Homoserinibacter gongjuensis TaxID=1162968 RepID=A0ABQ6JSI0_9MICO|nr:hypothetical protein [Homoserinibacter gongjuensis]GMA90451.1 hypothetical protein GCM10025869_09800 [Homoserinibacter gongjuensis]